MNYGRYEIIRELGKGAMGVVYQARDPQIGRIIALKILRPDRVSTESFVYRFLKEARAIGRLSHPNIVTVYDIGEDQGTVFIAMEYVEGEPLVIIAQKKRWTENEIISFGIDVAETLHYAHQKGIIHRDIKPSNIIITPEGKVKITDFGIAHIEDPSLSLQTQAGEILGTPAYMSPEQVLSRPVDGRSDLFSLGIILYELASGRRPFEGESLASVFNAITQATPAEPSLINATISRPFSDLLMKCVRKDPNERFESGRALAEALTSIKQAKVSAPIKKPGRAEKQKTVAVLVSVIIALLIGIGGLSYYFLFGTNGGPPVASIRANRIETFLRVQSTPVGAQVFIDGALKGKTPFRMDLPAGKHEVRLALSEYYDWQALVTLVEGSEKPLDVKLLSMSEDTP